MRLPGGCCYSHLHYVCVCVHTHPTHTHTHKRSVDSRGLARFWCSCSPRGAEQDRRFMFSVVQTRFSRVAPRSLGLLHGHTCYSNKLYRAPLESLMDFKGWSDSPPLQETRRRRHNAWSIAGTTYLHRGRKRTTKSFSHPSWLATFIRPSV